MPKGDSRGPANGFLSSFAVVSGFRIIKDSDRSRCLVSLRLNVFPNGERKLRRKGPDG